MTLRGSKKTSNADALRASGRDSSPLFLGVDLGTSALKCGLFDLAGNCAAAARISYPTNEWEGGAQQHCADWWIALSSALRVVTAPIDRRRIAAIGVGGHAPSPVFVDAHLRPVWPVLPWIDGRSTLERDQILEVLARAPENGPERLMVQIAARAMWLRKNAPGEFAQAACVLHSGDYLIARLSGRRVTTSPNVPDVFAAAKLSLALLPENECRPGEVVGEISSAAAEELGLEASLRVVSGGLDSFLASVGSGMREPGDACLNTGSAAVVAMLAPAECAGRFEWMGFPILSRLIRPGGRTLQWAARLAGADDSLAGLLAQAAHWQPPLSIHCRLAHFMREANGEDREVRSALADLAARYSPSETCRLLVDAIFLSQRRTLEELEQQAGPAWHVRSVGGLAAYPEINQLQADILGRALEVPRITESGALGAAMLAATALGHCTAREAASRMVRPHRTYEPHEEIGRIYDGLFHEVYTSTVRP
jgi:sugar (pentulose or hexulose) kinase